MSDLWEEDPSEYYGMLGGDPEDEDDEQDTSEH